MQSLQTTLSNVLPMSRTLSSLTKEHLFQYPDAMRKPDGSLTDDHYWNFCMELLARHGTEVVIADRVNHAQRRRDEARREAVNFTQKEGHEESDVAIQKGLLNRVTYAERNLDMAKRDAERARKETKTVSRSEIEAHFRDANSGKWEEAVRRFRQGALFSAQQHGFADMLMAPKQEIIYDRKEWAETENLGLLCSMQDGEEFKEMRAMFQIRILPSFESRERFLEEGGKAVSTSLKDADKWEYRRWFREYNGMTLKMQWRDSSGVAYNTSQFDPTGMSKETVMA